MRHESFEEQQEALDPHRREERDSAALEIAGRFTRQLCAQNAYSRSGRSMVSP